MPVTITMVAVAAALIGWRSASATARTITASIPAGSAERRGFELNDNWSRAFGEPPLGPPVVAGSNVIVTTAIDTATDSTVHALDTRSGKVRWTRHLEQRIDTVPVAAQGTVLTLLADGQLLALDAKDGTTRWTARTGTNVKGPPAPLVHGTHVYVGSQRGEVRSIDLSTGTVRWQRALDVGVQVTPALRDGTLYVATGQLPFGSDSRGSVYALAADSGKTRWHVRVDGPVTSALAVDELVVAVATSRFAGTQDGTLWVIDRRDGTVRWHATPGGRISAPVATIGFVVTATAAGVLEARPQWLTGADAGHVTSRTAIGRTQAPELLDRGDVIATGATGIVAVDPNTGAPIWRAHLPDAHLTTAPGSRYAVAQGSRTGDLAYLDTADGRILASRDLHDVPQVTLADHRIYRVDLAGTITATSLQFHDNLPASLRECRGVSDGRFAGPDGLPPKGSTDEAQVRAVLATNAERIRSQYPGVRELRVEPRNGAVWVREPDGAISTETVNDYWIVVEMQSESNCPSIPAFFNGVPVRFVAPAK